MPLTEVEKNTILYSVKIELSETFSKLRHQYWRPEHMAYLVGLEEFIKRSGYDLAETREQTPGWQLPDAVATQTNSAS
jgi:hypothetical protein